MWEKNVEYLLVIKNVIYLVLHWHNLIASNCGVKWMAGIARFKTKKQKLYFIPIEARKPFENVTVSIFDVGASTSLGMVGSIYSSVGFIQF